MRNTLPLLIVEDDELVRSFLSRALADLAGEVTAVATGAEATRAVERHRFGAILLDGLLPDTHGVDLGRRLVALPNGMRSGICFVSGSLRRPLPLHSGVSALPKPLRLRELTAAVDELLDWGKNAGTALVDRLAALDTLAANLLVS
ncbi:MAG: response regulator [Candidatus Dormibacter sp.]